MQSLFFVFSKVSNSNGVNFNLIEAMPSKVEEIVSNSNGVNFNCEAQV